MKIAARKNGLVVPHIRQGRRKGAICVCLYPCITVKYGNYERERPRGVRSVSLAYPISADGTNGDDIRPRLSSLVDR